MTPFTRHYSHYYYHYYYTSNNNGSENHKTPLHFAIPLYIRELQKIRPCSGNPHTRELAMARLSSSANTDTTNNNRIPKSC